jgi:hypothetical protein
MIDLITTIGFVTIAAKLSGHTSTILLMSPTYIYANNAGQQ